jgi:hypothetical protein
VIALPQIAGTTPFSGNSDDEDKLLAPRCQQIKQVGRI